MQCNYNSVTIKSNLCINGIFNVESLTQWNPKIGKVTNSSQVKSSLRLFRPPLTQTQRSLQDHKKKSLTQNK